MKNPAEDKPQTEKPQTFAEFYSAKRPEAVRDVQETAAAVREPLLDACQNAPADDPLTQAGWQALRLLNHMDDLLIEEQKRPEVGYSPAGALGELFNKALFPKRQKPTPVLEFLSKPLTETDTQFKRHEDPFDPGSCERQRIAMMLLLYIVMARNGGRVPTLVQQRVAGLNNKPRSGKHWWKVGRYILQENEAALQQLGLATYKTARDKRDKAADTEFRSQLKEHFLAAHARFRRDSVLTASLGIFNQV